MNRMAISIPTSLGEIVNIKAHLDVVKNNYQEIKIHFKRALWNDCLHTDAADWKDKQVLWDKYLTDIGQLFFSDKPYVLSNDTSLPFYDMGNLALRFNLKLRKAEMGHLLCQGTPLEIGEYIVITTKVRQIDKGTFYPLSIQLWKTLRQLSAKYKVVILGERQVEMRKEYLIPEFRNSIFGIYEWIIANLPADRIVDLTIPALGETVADLKQVQQDCLIMRDAKLVITLGVGGNFCLATSVANMAIGYRADNLDMTNAIFGREYPNAVITKDWSHFIRTLEKYT